MPPISTGSRSSLPSRVLEPANLVSVDATRSFDDLPGHPPKLKPLPPFRFTAQDSSIERAVDTYDGKPNQSTNLFLA